MTRTWTEFQTTPSQLGTEAETLRDRRTTRERPRPEFFRSTPIEHRKLGFYEIEREDFG